MLLETKRLALRPFVEADADAVFEMRRDEDIMRFIRAPQTQRTEAVRWMEMISEKWATEGIGFCAIFEKETKRFVGWCGLWFLKETEEIEVGYAISKEFWGRGFATEAAHGFLGYGFETLGLERIVAVAYPENEPSQNVMKKLGMTYVGRGNFYNTELVQYAITKDEFFGN